MTVQETSPLAIVLSAHLSPTPRQRNILSALSQLGCRTLSIGWDRDRDEHVARWVSDEHLVIGTRAPRGRASLVRRLPDYHEALREALRTLLCSGRPPALVVAGHALHLPLMRAYPEAPWIYDAAEYYADDLARYAGVFQTVLRPILRRWERHYLRHARGVFAADSRDGWYARRLALCGRPVLVVPNYPSRDDDPHAFDQGTIHGDGVIAYAGGLQDDKGLAVIVEALRLLRQERAVRMLIVGLESHLTLEDVSRRFRRAGLDEAIDVWPQRSYPELVSLLAGRADIGLALYQPHHRRRRLGATNARKIFTYFQAGLAVVVSHWGDLSRPVVEEDAGVVVEHPDDPREVAQVLSGLLAQPSRLAAQRIRARQAFVTKYNWETFVPTLRQWLTLHLPALKAESAVVATETEAATHG